MNQINQRNNTGRLANDIIKFTTTDPFVGRAPLIHCISADKKMSAGAANIVQCMYNVRAGLPSRLEVGMAYRVAGAGRVIYNLVTKKAYHNGKGPATMEAFIKCLESLHILTLDNEEYFLECVPLGQGRDRLPFHAVREAINERFTGYKIQWSSYLPSSEVPTRLICAVPAVKRYHWYSSQEFITGAACCGLSPQQCVCLYLSPINTFRLHQMMEVMEHYYDRPKTPFGLEVQRLLVSIEEYCRPYKCNGLAGFIRYGVPRIVYNEDKPKDLIPLAVYSRKAFEYIFQNPYLLYTFFFIDQLEPVEQDEDSSEDEPENEVVTPVSIPVKPMTAPNKPVVSVLARSRRWDKRFDNVTKDTGYRKKKNDFDRWYFEATLRMQRKHGLPSRLQPPASMKVEFAAEKVMSVRTSKVVPGLQVLREHRSLRIKPQYELRRFMGIKDDLDEWIFSTFNSYVKTRDMKRSVYRTFNEWKEFGLHNNRKLWYQLACHVHRRTFTDFSDTLEEFNVKDFTEMRHFSEFTARVPKRGCLEDIQDLKLTSFAVYCTLFHLFRNDIRSGMGYKARHIELTPTNLLSAYIHSCTNQDLKSTMFKYRKVMDEGLKAAKNFNKLNMPEINDCVKEATRTMKDSQFTIDRLNDMMRKMDRAGLDQLVMRMNSIMGKSDAFLKLLCSPIGNQAFEMANQFLYIPGDVMSQIKAKFTPMNLVFITFMFICYQHSDSILMKSCYITAILHSLDLFKPGCDLMMKFVRGFAHHTTPVGEEPQETSITDICAILAQIVSGGANVIGGLISGIYTMIKGSIMSAKTLRKLLSLSGSFGRDINFAFLGFQNAPKLWQHVVGAWRTVSHHLFSTEKPNDDVGQWQKAFDKWKILLHVLEDPRILTLLRISDEARGHVDNLYKAGIELLKTAKGPELRREAQELTRLMGRAKEIADLIESYRAYNCERLTPYVVCFTSEAGTGKTNLIHMLKHILSKYMYDGMDPDAIIYNVPLENDHYDGYADHLWLLLDDYNLINDPSWVARVCPITSNVPQIFPMSHLRNKGATNKAHGVVQTTNNAYSTPNGVTHPEAIKRRRNHVINVTVHPKYKKDGHVDKATIISVARHDMISKNSCPKNLSKEEREEWLDREANAFYDNMLYYTFEIKCVMEDKVRFTLSAKEFFTFFLRDFAEHREREAALLKMNRTPPIDEEKLRECQSLQRVVEDMRAELTAHRQLIVQYLQAEPEVLELQPPEVRKWITYFRECRHEFTMKTLGKPSEWCKWAYDSAANYVKASGLRELFTSRYNNDLTRAIDEVIAMTPIELETPEIPVEDEPQPGCSTDDEPRETGTPFTVPNEINDRRIVQNEIHLAHLNNSSRSSYVSPTQIGNKTNYRRFCVPTMEQPKETMFTWLRNSEDSVSTHMETADSESVVSEEEEEVEIPPVADSWYTMRNLQDYTSFKLELNECRRLDFNDSPELEQPRFGWLGQEFYMAHMLNGSYMPQTDYPNTPLIPLPSRIATDFLTRLRLAATNFDIAEFVHAQGGDYIPLENEEWFIAYPNTNQGVGLCATDRESDWMKESAFTFSMISQEQRYQLYKTRVDLETNYVELRVLIQEVADPILTRRQQASNFFHRAWTFMSPILQVFLATAIYLVMYICLLYGLAWLLNPNPNPTQTKYNVDPRRQQPKKLVWHATADPNNVVAVHRRIQDNLQVVARYVGESCTTAQCMYVHGSNILVPAHFLHRIEDEFSLYVTSPEFPDINTAQPYIVSKEDIYYFPGKDCAMINLRYSSRCAKSALHYLVKENEVDALMGRNIRICQRDPETHAVLMAVTRITGHSQISLKTLPEPVDEFIYDGSAPFGSSGGPVYIMDPKVRATIAGFQSASTSSWGCFSPITYEEVMAGLETLQSPTYEDIDVDEEVWECNRVEILQSTHFQTTPASEIFTHSVVVGKQNPENSPYVMRVSHLHKSPIADVLPDVGREPAILSDYDRRRHHFLDKPHYLNKSLNKFCRDQIQPISPREMDRIVEARTTFDFNRGYLENLRVLTIEEALVPTDLDASTLDFTTSPGLPWSLESSKSKGKLAHLQKNSLGELTYISPRLRKSCEDLLEKLKSNVVPFYLQNDFMKDELRDATLGKQNVTRTVTVLPMHVTIVARQLMLDYHSRLHSQAKLAGRCAVGVNMDSRTSSLMLEKLCSRSAGRYCIDFDVSNWDGHYPGWLGEMLVRRRNAAYRRANPTDTKTLKARDCLYRSMMFGFVQFGNLVYRKYRGMSSGFCGTGEDNSEAHDDLLYTIWRLLARRAQLLEYLSFKKFLDCVVLFVYGDDIIISIDEEVVPWFNGLTIAAEYERLGWPVTPAQKGGELVSHRPWHELTFLKRQFVPDPMLGVVFTPLDLETIRSLFIWMRGENKQQFYSNLHDASRFLVHHGRDQFESTLGVVKDALRICMCQDIYENYDDLLDCFLANYDKI